MNKKVFSVLILLNLLNLNLFCQATFTSTGAGTSWDNPGNWSCFGDCVGRNYPGEPGPLILDRVEIYNNINLSNGISPVVDEIIILDAILTVRGTTGVPTLTASHVTITSITSGAEFNVYNNGAGSPTVNILGNVIITRASTSTAPTRFRIGSDPAATASVTSSIVTIGGGLNYSYEGNHAGSESLTEIAVGSMSTTPSVNDNCQLIILGDVNLTYNFATDGSGNVLAFEVGHSCSVSMNNLTMQILESSGTSSGSDVRMSTKDNQGASITINGDASLIWNDASSPNGGSDIYLKAGDDNAVSITSISILGDLEMTSKISTGLNNVHLRGSGSSLFTLNGNLNFEASSASGAHIENRVRLNDNSTLDIKGAINNLLEGSFDFEPTGTIADNCTIKFSGNVQQNFPEKFPLSTSYYKNVTINNSSNIPFTIPNATLNVEGNLSMMDGVINSTATNQFVFESGATSNGGTATSYITGPVLKKGGTDLTIPLGSGSKWAPLEIANIGSGGSAIFTAEYFLSKPLNITTDGTFDHVSHYEYWDLQVSGASPTLDLTLFWKDACASEIFDLTTGPSQDLFIGHYNGSDWNLQGGTYTISGQACGVPSEMGSIKVTGVSSFSPFTFAAINPTLNPLPITLTDFWAEVIDYDKVNLKWITESEINSDYFVIEKSIDGMTFYPIDTVAANGTTYETHYYEVIDPLLISGTSYYLLTQIDFDGTINKYKTISIVTSGMMNEAVSLFPIPARQGQPLELVVRKDLRNEPINFKVYSFLGDDITNDIEFEPIGLNRTLIKTSRLNPGVYVLFCFNNYFSSTHKVIIH